MSVSLINTIILGVAFLMLFAFSEVLYHRFKVRAEVTRKIVHIFTGILALLFPLLIGNHWLVLALCGSFLLILIFSYPFKLLPSINAVDRTTRGSILYPVIVYCCFLVYEDRGSLSFYYIPILILAICDPIAALIGKRFPWISYTFLGHSKTISGSLGFFFIAGILSFILLTQFQIIPQTDVLLMSISIAVITTIAEALIHKGYDNLTIPASALGMLLIFEYYGWLS